MNIAHPIEITMQAASPSTYGNFYSPIINTSKPKPIQRCSESESSSSEGEKEPITIIRPLFSIYLAADFKVKSDKHLYALKEDKITIKIGVRPNWGQNWGQA